MNNNSTSRHPLPPLRDPSAPRGPTYTSVVQWLHNNPENNSSQPISSTTGSTLSDSTNSSCSEPLVRIIVAEPNENAVAGDDEDGDQNDADDLPSSSSQSNNSGEQDDEPEE